MSRRIIVFALGVLVALWTSPAFAVLEPCDPPEDTEQVGTATTITFDSCFQDLDYTQGDPLTLTFDWMVANGTCTYDGFELRGKGYTPVSKRNNPAKSSPAHGSARILLSGDSGDGTYGSVIVEVTFDALHSGKNGKVAVGNGHFRLKLNCDTDGDLANDTMASLGVNVHVKDPQ